MTINRKIRIKILIANSYVYLFAQRGQSYSKEAVLRLKILLRLKMLLILDILLIFKIFLRFKYSFKSLSTM